MPVAHLLEPILGQEKANPSSISTPRRFATGAAGSGSWRSADPIRRSPRIRASRHARKFLVVALPIGVDHVLTNVKTRGVAYRRLVTQGWTDALRALHPGERIYTFWKYFRNAFARDAGLRIDHLLLSPPSAKRLVSAGVDREVRGREHASDHAPAWIELAEPPKAPPGRARRLKRES